MTQKDKDLLLRDLCARLPYDIIGYMEIDLGSDEIRNYGYLKLDVELLGIDKDDESIRVIATNTATEGQSETLDYMQDDDPFKIEDIEPYLRPMSSMTEKEKDEYMDLYNEGQSELLDKCIEAAKGNTFIVPVCYSCIDWLNSHHFDYRGLIEKGLALEAPKGMYKV